VSKVVLDVVENSVPPEKIIYLDQINEFTRSIVDEILKELLKLKKLFKYFVTVFVQQKNGSAMNYGSNLYILILRFLFYRRFF
jgi:hypothetical protein